jgi:uncharacterized protein (DUF697 family)
MVAPESSTVALTVDSEGVGSGEPAPGPSAEPTGEQAGGAGAEASAAGVPGRLWDRMRADPQYAPEHLALEAVRRLGPEAARWAERTRQQQPGITDEALAQLAVRRFTTHARLSGAMSGAAGLPGAVVDVGVLAWTQARMVLHIAAAYGADPAGPERAVDLLVLQKVHRIAETARLALGVAAGRERASSLFSAAGGAPLGRVVLRLGVRLAQMAGIRAARRIFAKMIPGAAVILGTWANSTATTELARRATTLYRDRAQDDRAQDRRALPA